MLVHVFGYVTYFCKCLAQLCYTVNVAKSQRNFGALTMTYILGTNSFVSVWLEDRDSHSKTSALVLTDKLLLFGNWRLAQARGRRLPSVTSGTFSSSLHYFLAGVQNCVHYNISSRGYCSVDIIWWHTMVGSN